MKKIKEHWVENKDKYEKAICFFYHGGNLNDINIEQHYTENKYLDYRGINLETIEINNLYCNKIDFSFSNFQYSRITKSIFIDVIFDSVDFKNMVEFGNAFINCSFVNCKFNIATLGFEGSKYQSCIFNKSNFIKCNFIRAEFDSCIFENCKLKNIDFYGSSFENCSFIGVLDDVWFRGNFPHPSDYKSFGYPKKNEMKNVSFENAELRNLAISDNCDLSTIILPQNKNYIIFDKWKNRLRHLQDEVQKWNNEKDKETALLFIRINGRYEQNWILLNIKEDVGYYGEDELFKILDCLNQLY